MPWTHTHLDFILFRLSQEKVRKRQVISYKRTITKNQESICQAWHLLHSSNRSKITIYKIPEGIEKMKKWK